MKISIENAQNKIPFTDSLNQLLNKVVELSLKEADFETEVEVYILLIDNKEIKEINKKHRNIDAATDVLSFPILELIDGKLETVVGDYDYEGKTLLLGDIIISMEMAEIQAAEYGHSFEREVAFLTSHGMFHLLGYDHANDIEEKNMLEKQEKVLALMELTR